MTKRITLKEFQRRFHKVRERGFVKSLRRGPTGIGFTLASELGLSEDTFDLADLGRVTIVPARATSQEMIPFVRLTAIAREDLLATVRSSRDVERRGMLPGLNAVVEQAPNSDGLFMQFRGEHIALRSITGSLVKEWPYDEIALAQHRNAGHILYIYAVAERRLSGESLFFLRGQLFCRVGKYGLALGGKSGDTSLMLNQRVIRNSVGKGLTPHLYVRVNEYWRFFESVQDI